MSFNAKNLGDFLIFGIIHGEFLASTHGVTTIEGNGTPSSRLNSFNKAKLMSIIRFFTSLPNSKFARTLTAARFSKIALHRRVTVM